MSVKNYKRYRNNAKIVCPFCKKKYLANSKYTCPYCYSKYYDLSFITFNEASDTPMFFKVRGRNAFCQGQEFSFDMIFATNKAELDVNISEGKIYDFEKSLVPIKDPFRMITRYNKAECKINAEMLSMEDTLFTIQTDSAVLKKDKKEKDL